MSVPWVRILHFPPFLQFFFYAQIKNFMRNWVQRPTQAGNQIQVGKNTKLEEWSSGLRQRFAKA